MYSCICPEYTPQKDEGCIYLYEFDNGMKYVGQTRQSLSERHRGHVRNTKKHGEQFVDRFIRTHSWNLRILWVGPCQELTKKENEYILKYNTIWPEGYNLHLEDELYTTSRKYINGVNPASKKVHLYNIEGLYIKSFDSVSQAQKFLGLDDGNTSRQQAGKRLIGKKYYLRYDSLPFLSIMKPPVPKKSRQRQVCQIDPKTGLIINTFSGCREACRQTGIDSSQITSCCKKTGYNLTGGYMWAYQDSDENILPLSDQQIIKTQRYIKSKDLNFKKYVATNIYTGKKIIGTQFEIQDIFNIDTSQVTRKKYIGYIHKKGKLKNWKIEYLLNQ